MKDKVFIFISVGFMIAVMIIAPLTFFLNSAGIIKYDDLGNVIMPNRVYSDDEFFAVQLNAIEEGKAKLIDIYTNYLPGYSIIVSELGTLKVDFNRPVYSLYSEIAIKQINAANVIEMPLNDDIIDIDNAEQSDDIDDAIDITDIKDTADTDDVDNDVDNTEEIELKTDNEPAKITGEGVPVVPKIAKYSANFLKPGVYAIDVEFEDGTKTGLLTLTNTDSASKIRERVQSQVKEINRIAAATPPDVNVYVYACSRFQDSEFFPQYVPGVQSLKPFVDEFFAALDDRIKYDRLKVDSLEDSIQKLFLTDHHWNAYGVYEAYFDIITMISADSPSIGSPRPLGTRHIIDGAAFCGSNARMNNYYNYRDIFYFYDYNLPEHEIQTTQQYKGFERLMNDYLKGGYSTSRDTDHYVNFYPYASYVKYPENNTGRKLLLLGDSYSRGISELLSSNFDEAHIYDFRRIQEIGDYNKYIEQHGITDVLFMQYSLRGIFNDQRDNTLDLIRTK